MVYDKDSRLLLILQKRSDSWQRDRKPHHTILHIAITVTSVWHNLRIDDLLSETGFFHITTKEHFKTNSPQQLTLDVDHRSTQNNNVAQGFEKIFKQVDIFTWLSNFATGCWNNVAEQVLGKYQHSLPYENKHNTYNVFSQETIRNKLNSFFLKICTLSLFT